MASPIPQPSASAHAIHEIVGLVLKGQVRVPEFQRGLRWQWDDVRRLFDSIAKGYPIGSLLFWEREAPAGKVHLGSLTIDAPEQRDALWVVDGQQRITALACSLTESPPTDPRFLLTYDLDEGVFARGPSTGPAQVPLPVLFSPQRVLRWFHDQPAVQSKVDVAIEISNAIRNYRIPAYVVRQDDEAVLRDIFDRMNNYGKRLSRAEVFTALHAARDDRGESISIADIAEYLDGRTQFGPLADDTVLAGMLSRRSPDHTRKVHLEFDESRKQTDFPSETEAEAYQGARAALERAIQFLQTDGHVPHVALLPNSYLLVALSRFFAHHPDPASRNRDLLRRWLWRAAASGAATRGNPNSWLRRFNSAIVPADENRSIRGLLEAVPGTLPLFVLPERFHVNTAEVRVALAALWGLGPISPLSDERYTDHQLRETLLGRKTATDALELLLPARRENGAKLSNRFYLVGEDEATLTRSLLVGELLGGDPAQVLLLRRSHAITEGMAAQLRNDEDEAFLAARRDLIESVTRDFLARMAETSFEDTPPLDDLNLDDPEPGDDARA